MSNYSMTELNSGHPIFVYFHGNKRSRSARTRTSTYKRISSLGYHVIAFDYRGYGDSSGRMTGEKDCVQDSISVLKYVYEHKGSSPVYFYGHSLGTGVVGSVVAFLKSKGNATLTDISLPDGIVLDSAFTSLADAAIKTFPDWVYRILPLHKITQKLGVEFNSMKNLYGLQKPMLILHAEDDPTVPFNQGKQLAEHLQRQSPVTFVPFSAGRQLGHNSIYSVEEFAKILNQMVQLRNVTHSTTGNVNVCS
ncbi:unnamed protein product [Dicrocoelium dendriticum]|nr:unnamed protein product [Dicrocoelium dendriticum]